MKRLLILVVLMFVASMAPAEQIGVVETGNIRAIDSNGVTVYDNNENTILEILPTFIHSRKPMSITGTASYMDIKRLLDTAGGAPYLILGHARSIDGVTPLPLSDTDDTGSVYFYGYDVAAGWQPTARIRSIVDGPIGSNDMPGALIFYVVADGTNTLQEAARISNDKSAKFSGDVVIGTTDTPIDMLHIYAGDSGGTPVAASHATIESNGDTAMSILSPSSNFGAYYFGDEVDADVGGIYYNHDTDKLSLMVNGSAPGGDKFSLNSAGEIRMSEVYGDTGGAINIALFVDNQGKLGADGSARRFKENERPIQSSDRVLARQILALLKKYDRRDGAFVGEVGLIAEEMYALDQRFVACEVDVFVVGNPDGTTSTLHSESDRPLSVRWHRVAPFLFAVLGHEVQALKVRENLQRRQIEWFRAEADRRGWDMTTFPLE